jgi:hypothetical protein
MSGSASSSYQTAIALSRYWLDVSVAYLDDETVERCTEDTIIVVTVDEHGVCDAFIRLDTVHDWNMAHRNIHV